uniref:Uncharacterized protein n=1 Tax=Chlamydomonas euryale TaxID=1486919 RepID=A0A7R9V815_9CHLO|mmetsp:Transcript_2450/g.6552  ORF Transcript_2450/g.6552 Transcript_2450/m.6552 type:complete len:258 (+) Transcript_2450:103-876(+)
MPLHTAHAGSPYLTRPTPTSKSHTPCPTPTSQSHADNATFCVLVPRTLAGRPARALQLPTAQNVSLPAGCMLVMADSPQLPGASASNSEGSGVAYAQAQQQGHGPQAALGLLRPHPSPSLQQAGLAAAPGQPTPHLAALHPQQAGTSQAQRAAPQQQQHLQSVESLLLGHAPPNQHRPDGRGAQHMGCRPYVLSGTLPGGLTNGLPHPLYVGAYATRAPAGVPQLQHGAHHAPAPHGLPSTLSFNGLPPAALGGGMH